MIIYWGVKFSPWNVSESSTPVFLFDLLILRDHEGSFLFTDFCLPVLSWHDLMIWCWYTLESSMDSYNVTSDASSGFSTIHSEDETGRSSVTLNWCIKYDKIPENKIFGGKNADSYSFWGCYIFHIIWQYLFTPKITEEEEEEDEEGRNARKIRITRKKKLKFS